MKVPAPVSDLLEHIVLTGFMGAGKTTVGRTLAERLRWTFADLDDAVSQRVGMTVPAIFAAHGEAAFREAEVSALRDLLCAPGRVIALGGGAPETPTIQALLAASKTTVVVHLHAPFEVLFARCVEQSQDPHATHRPLLGTRAAAAARYARRQPVYTRVAQVTANADAPPDFIADEILARLQKTHCWN